MHVARRINRVVVLALAIVLWASAGASARDVPRGFYGAVYDGPGVFAPEAAQDAQFAAMRAAGVEAVRAVFFWAAAQPEDRPQYDFGLTDGLVSLAARHGLSLLPVVIGTPEWAKARPTVDNSPPASPGDYAAYLRALVLRYGDRGSFWSLHPELPYRPIRYWQIWNEPHLRLYWNASRWQRGYGALLRAAGQAVKGADARARIVLAGMTGASWDALASLYKQSKVRGAFDVAALQTYTGNAPHLLKAVRLFRRVLARHRAAKLPLWLTEMGWPAAKGRISVPRYQRTIATTDAGMARRLTAGYALLARVRRRPDVRVSRVYWYTWSSPYTPSSDPGTGIFRYAGLFRYDGTNFTPTAAYRAYARSAHSHERSSR